MERLCQSIKTIVKRPESAFSISFTFKLEDNFLQFEVVRNNVNIYLYHIPSIADGLNFSEFKWFRLLALA